MAAYSNAGGVDNTNYPTAESMTRVHVPTIAWVALLLVVAFVVYRVWRKG